MQIYETIAAMRNACRAARLQHGAAPLQPAAPSQHHERQSLGLVPTMGALHAGHLSLVQRARAECQTVAVTIFVNPLQFAPGEDFDRYPRHPEADCKLLEAAGVDLVFLPVAGEMFPPGAKSTVDVATLGERLDGAHRPGHFRGVATVVAKLFHIVEPDLAYFGQKDAVQIALLRQMIHDLDFDLRLIACKIVRDHDGLALSSRNQYLSTPERAQALAIPSTLNAMQELIAAGQGESAQLLQAGRSMLEQAPGLTLEYLEAVDPHTLEPSSLLTPGTLVAVAARIGKTRLIDNFLVG